MQKHKDNIVFINSNVSRLELKLWGFTTDEIVKIQPHWNMANIMVEGKKFATTSDARRAGYNIPIPEGYSEYTGRMTSPYWRIFVYNPTRKWTLREKIKHHIEVLIRKIFKHI